MPETVSIWLPDAKSTHFAGKSLAASIHEDRLTIGLSGDLGAGKTSFLQGFLKGLGVDESVMSPTYALEQRYDSRFGEVLHIDLYRLNSDQAKELMEQSQDHTGLRCIEWVERCRSIHQDIAITLSEEEEKEGRSLSITFNDIDLPTQPQIEAWRKEVQLPSHIVDHCNAVAAFGNTLADTLLERGEVIRKDALHTAALMHDLLRFIDFKQEKIDGVWSTWKKRYPGKSHEEACAQFATDQGYPELGEIIRPHGLAFHPIERATIEQKILYYADKRVMQDTVVSLEERFDDFTMRYGGGKQSAEGKKWYEQAKQLETELHLT